MSKFNTTYNIIIECNGDIIDEDLKKLLASGLIAGSLLGGALNADGAVADSKYHPKDSNRILLMNLQNSIDANNRLQIANVSLQTLRNLTMKIAIPLIKSFLGAVRDRQGNHIVYDDLNNKNTLRRGLSLLDFNKRSKGRPTIGYGCINKSILAKRKISLSLAISLLTKHANFVYNQIKRHLSDEVFGMLNPNQRAALVSLYYNFGTKFDKTPLLLSAIETQDWITAARNFLDCNNITKDGKLVTCPGLTVRRQKLADLFTKPYYRGK